jgi:hypothetical protein
MQRKILLNGPSKIGSMDGKEKRSDILDFEGTFSNIDVLCALRCLVRFGLMLAE